MLHAVWSCSSYITLIYLYREYDAGDIDQQNVNVDFYTFSFIQQKSHTDAGVFITKRLEHEKQRKEQKLLYISFWTAISICPLDGDIRKKKVLKFSSVIRPEADEM